MQIELVVQHDRRRTEFSNRFDRQRVDNEPLVLLILPASSENLVMENASKWIALGDASCVS